MMRLTECQADLLRQLAQTPFADRVELAAFTGWSQSAVYRQMAEMERLGLVEHLAHATALIPTTRRFCLSAHGVEQLARERGERAARLLRRSPVSHEWRRLLLQRLDTAAVLYRLTTAIGESHHPLRLCWFRAQAMDAVVELSDGRSLALARIGRTADRTSMAKRLRRLDETLGVGAALIVLPDEVRLRHARRVVAGCSMMAFLAVERDAVNAGAEAAIWRIASGNPRFTLGEALSYAIRARDPFIEQPLTQVSMPRALGDAGAVSLSATEQRALDFIGDWPWLRPAHLADLLDCGQRRTSRILNWLVQANLVTRQNADGKPRLALSDTGIAHIARRDRAAVGIAKQRWSAETVATARPLTWRNVSGARSRQLLRHLDHTESVHWFIAQLAKQTEEEDLPLIQIDPPHRASRYFRFEGVVRSIHPDAFALLRAGDRLQAVFLEYERRADRPATMRDRLAPYLRYYSTRRPLEDHGVIPKVLVVFENELTAHHFLRFAASETLRCRVQIPLLVSHRHALERDGPLGAAWRSPTQQSTVSLRDAG